MKKEYTEEEYRTIGKGAIIGFFLILIGLIYVFVPTLYHFLISMSVMTAFALFGVYSHCSDRANNLSMRRKESPRRPSYDR